MLPILLKLELLTGLTYSNDNGTFLLPNITMITYRNSFSLPYLTCLNLQTLQFVSLYRDPQLEVGKKYLFMLTLKHTFHSQ